MGLFRMAAKAGIAKKVLEEARKPQNQAKAKEVIAKLRDKGGTAGPETGARQTRRGRRT